MPEPTMERLFEEYERHWGRDPDMLLLTAPTVAHDTRFGSDFVRYQRLSIPPGAATSMYRWVLGLDVRPVLPTISVPTLVLHRTGAAYHRVAFGRYLAEHITDAKIVELEGSDTYPFWAGRTDDLLGEIQEFLTGFREGPPADRVLATVLFTDIVDSTDTAARVGDARWLELLEAHNRLVREHLAELRGREVSTTGDGFLAIFDGPARAVRCAVRIRDAVEDLDLRIRAGLHTGEVELRGDEIGGIAVHLAARVMAEAQPEQVLVSGTLTDLVVGSGIRFEDRGERALKGVPGTRRMFEVVALP
jgi:class 3 adenylate cyclase